ncbi:MAG: hypothetical protein NT034_04110 [Candidatus Magasanikbacteria bacterium]|nr:hypothetical protein [Candidatus Magasanikbacteria bacterium]
MINDDKQKSPDKQLKEKAVKIQGKNYVLVADRIVFFNENYLNGSIKTELISPIESEYIIIKATVTPDTDKSERFFTGYSQVVKGVGYINKTSALENAETSAVGRALAMLGIGVIESVASADEINKARQAPPLHPTIAQNYGIQKTNFNPPPSILNK